MAAQIEEIQPYRDAAETKKKQVRRMFDNIAPHYDFLNHFLSLGMDIRWRKKAVRAVGHVPRQRILDMATGTGDVAFMLAKHYPDASIEGVDLSDNMLRVARRKATKRQMDDRVVFSQGDSESLPIGNDTYDKVTVAFGVRNFEDLKTGLQELCRVLKPGGRIVVLEFTRPQSFPFKHLFSLYFRYLLPVIGRVRSGDRRAYRYLYESVQAFPDYKRFVDVLHEAGFANATYQTLSSGICAIYTAQK
jgi:demethylmenaquinone methyltransferase/2-methoxy-6-polyprenyl-1,4-benzoquinol methylase